MKINKSMKKIKLLKLNFQIQKKLNIIAKKKKLIIQMISKINSQMNNQNKLMNYSKITTKIYKIKLLKKYYLLKNKKKINKNRKIFLLKDS